MIPLKAGYSPSHWKNFINVIDHAVNKALTYDILWLLKCPGAICSNDAKSCYDLIGHTPESMAMKHLGVPGAFLTVFWPLSRKWGGTHHMGFTQHVPS